MRVLGYTRVSTEEQASSGLGLAAQEAALRLEADHRGWELEIVTDAGISGASIAKRPALCDALARLGRGEADALATPKLDRLSRSVADFAGMVERARRERWSLICLDLGVDTSTPTGEAMAGMVAVFAQMERRLIGERTRVALQAKKAKGARLGRPRLLSDEAVARAVALRADGLTLQATADQLTAEGFTRPKGGTWTPGAVASALRSSALDLGSRELTPRDLEALF